MLYDNFFIAIQCCDQIPIPLLLQTDVKDIKN